MRTFAVRRAGGRAGRRAVVSVVLLPSLLLGADLAAQDRSGREELKRFFAQAANEEGIVGAGMYLVGRNGVVDSAFTGLADRDEKRPVNGATIWHWASITKTFTAIGIMQLRDRKLLSLDDPIVKYVPELRAVHNPHGSMEGVTIRHLLSHSSGFRSPTWPWGGNKPWHPFEPTGWSQLVAMFPYTDIMFPPGSRFQYSNPGIVFLGEALRRLTGDEYEVYADKNLLDPLGMYSSYYDVTPYHLRVNRSNNYYIVDGQTRANGIDFDTGITTSNGGLNAPLADMAKYLRFLLGGGGALVLERSTLEEMWRPVVPAGGAPGPQGERQSVGLGFFVTEYPGGLRLIGHTGSQAGFRSFFWLHPESGLALIANFNTSPPSESAGPEVKPRIGRIFGGMLERFVKLVGPAEPQ
ncbi:MAG TPA: serine hydrolase domain-containing protein [Gemmatimonadales bacterium]|nr:serine hydrolase domain-containing protein [Gemmatimonadales bacterium]